METTGEIMKHVRNDAQLKPGDEGILITWSNRNTGDSGYATRPPEGPEYHYQPTVDVGISGTVVEFVGKCTCTRTYRDTHNIDRAEVRIV